MKRVLEIFEEISAIPRGSGNQKGIADYCESFAARLGLWCHRDEAENLIIKKKGTGGYESSPAVILQGHMDMVCQKEDTRSVDFEKDGIKTRIDGEFLCADGTTLGADNGIALAMTLAILEREDLPCPPIEAVFTTDEEIGMLGAQRLDMNLLDGKTMINLDAEEEDFITVSCAGGSDMTLFVPLHRKEARGERIRVTLFGLQGGHSGVEIHRGRVNADTLAGDFLCHVADSAPFSLCSVRGGDKGNAIPLRSEILVLTQDAHRFCQAAEEYLSSLKEHFSVREPNFTFSVEREGVFSERVLDGESGRALAKILSTVPCGVMAMSTEIPGLVETSLNLGILETGEREAKLFFTLRSNRRQGLLELEEKMRAFAESWGVRAEKSGYYPPWEYREGSRVGERYRRLYRETFGKEVKNAALHAGLECGIFSAAKPELDIISIGPDLFDVHTVKEKMRLSSLERVYRVLLLCLKESK